MKSLSTKAWEKDGQEEGKASTEIVWKRIDPQSQTSAKKQLQLHRWTSAGSAREGRPQMSWVLMAQHFNVSGLTGLKMK